MARTLTQTVVVSSLFALCSASVSAQALTDPTQPPAGWGPGESPNGAPPAPARLQMIVHSPGAKPWALFDGRRVDIGDQVDGARLVHLTETEALFKGPDGTRRLSLAPGVSRQSTIPSNTPLPQEKRR